MKTFGKKLLTTYFLCSKITLSKVYKKFSKVREENYTPLDSNNKNLYKENYILTQTNVRYILIVAMKKGIKKKRAWHGVGAPWCVRTLFKSTNIKHKIQCQKARTCETAETLHDYYYTYLIKKIKQFQAFSAKYFHY